MSREFNLNLYLSFSFYFVLIYSFFRVSVAYSFFFALAKDCFNLGLISSTILLSAFFLSSNESEGACLCQDGDSIYTFSSLSAKLKEIRSFYVTLEVGEYEDELLSVLSVLLTVDVGAIGCDLRMFLMI